jgi:chloramphenicol-sensitive protein RarD
VATTQPGPDGRGLAQGLGAHVIWGFFPAFFALLAPAGPFEVVAHRIVWTLLLMAGVLAAVHGWRELRRLSARGWVTVTAAALCIAANWGLFISGVAIDRVVEIALG